MFIKNFLRISYGHTIKPGTPEHGTAEQAGTVGEQLNIIRNTSRTPRNNETIQNKEQLQCF